MLKSIEPQVVTHFQNGFADPAPEFVEIDGNKFEADPSDNTKAKVDENGKPVPYTEPAPADPANPADPAKDDLKDKSLEDLAEANPHVKKMLEDRAEEERKRIEAETKAAEEKGEWEKLATSRQQELDKLKADNAKKDEMLGKYVGTVKEILEQVKKDIPKENLGLIPDNFSPREQLAYITKNAKQLGVKGVGGGGGVKPNEAEPPTTDLAKAEAEYAEIEKIPAKDRTSAQAVKFYDLAKSIKKLRTEAAS